MDGGQKPMNPQPGKVSVFVLHGPPEYVRVRRMFAIDSYRPETVKVTVYSVDVNNNPLPNWEETSYPIEAAREMYRSCLSYGWKPVT